MRDLATIQQRFHALVTAGEGEIDRGLFGASRRLDVYADAYIGRLHDLLADDYPKLRAVIGEGAFRDLATAYVRAHPPTSFTVRDLGHALPAYLQARAEVRPWYADLAALERARVEVFDRADATPLSRADLAAVPMERFPELALILVPASMVVHLGWSVDDVWSALEEGAPRHEPEPCTRTVLVWRRELRVLHRTLDGDEAQLVPLLAGPTSLAAVSARLAETQDRAPEHRLVELLARWIDAEILAR